MVPTRSVELGHRLAAVVLLLWAGAVSGCGDDDGSAGSPTSTVVTSDVVTSDVVANSPAPSTAAVTTSAVVTTTVASEVPTSSAATTTTEPSVFEFLAAADAEGWRVINDTVMGGVSNGELAWTAGMLSFSGDLSLENNGGFASIRSPAIDPPTAAEWAARAGVHLVVEGDGRPWKVELRTGDDAGGWVATFTTDPSGVTEVMLPWSSFEPVTRFLEPRQASEPLDPTRMATVAFFLVDGVEGPFRLGLRSIG